MGELRSKQMGCTCEACFRVHSVLMASCPTCSKLVSLESLYGTCLRATPPVSALTTPASALRELLMDVSSLMRSEPMSVSCAKREGVEQQAHPCMPSVAGSIYCALHGAHCGATGNLALQGRLSAARGPRALMICIVKDQSG